jgi:hypothetical protein
MTPLTRYANLPRLTDLPDPANAFWNDALQVRKVLKHFAMWYEQIRLNGAIDAGIWGGNLANFQRDFAHVMVAFNTKGTVLTLADKQNLKTFVAQVRVAFPRFAHADNLPQDVPVASTDTVIAAWIVLVEGAVNTLIDKSNATSTGLIQTVFGASKVVKARRILTAGLAAIKGHVANSRIFSMEYGGYDITKVGATSNKDQLRIKRSDFQDPALVIDVGKKNQLIATLVHESTHAIADKGLVTTDHYYPKDNGFDGASEDIKINNASHFEVLVIMSLDAVHEYHNRTFLPGHVNAPNTGTGGHAVPHANVISAKNQAEGMAMGAWLSAQDYHGRFVKMAALKAQNKSDVEIAAVVLNNPVQSDVKRVGKWILYISKLFGLTIHKRANVKSDPLPIPVLLDLTTFEIKVGMITKIYNSCSNVAVTRDDFYYMWELPSTEVKKMQIYVIKECVRQCFDQYMHLKKGNNPDFVYTLIETLARHNTNGRFDDSLKAASSTVKV